MQTPCDKSATSTKSPQKMSDKELDIEWRSIGLRKLILRKTHRLGTILPILRQFNARLDLLIAEMLERQRGYRNSRQAA